MDWQFVRRQVLQRSLDEDELNEFGFFPACLPLLFHSVTVTPIIMAVYASCTLGLIIFLFSCISLPYVASPSPPPSPLNSPH